MQIRSVYTILKIGAFTAMSMMSAQTLQTPSIDRHVNEFRLFPIFINCVGYQE